MLNHNHRSMMYGVIVLAGGFSTHGIQRWILMLVLAVVLYWVVPHLEQANRNRSQELTHHELVEALNDIALSLSAGITVVSALRELSPTSGNRAHRHIAQTIALYDLGQDFPTALDSLIEHDAQWLPVVRMIQRSVISGGSLLEQLDAFINHLSAQAHSESLTRIRKVGVKALFPLTLCFLPAFMILTVVPMVIGLVSTISR